MSGGGLRVIAPGLHTTVQDFGRAGAQAFGVPICGMLDTEALRLANALVGNAADEAGLEILHVGPVLEVTAPSLRLALGAYGGEMVIEGETPCMIPPWRSVTLPRGTRLRIDAPRRAVCACLAIGGGLDVPLVAGSRSTYVPGGFGGWCGRTLVAGDNLPARQAELPTGPDLRLTMTPVTDQGALRVVPGPQDDHFSAATLRTFWASEYTVMHAADRMGARLSGPPLAFRGGHDTISDGTAAGAIQVAGDGQPMLLLADRQTTGGYPKIATVCTTDLSRVGRLRPGDRVRFMPISVEAAQSLRRWHESAVLTMLDGIVPL